MKQLIQTFSSTKLCQMVRDDIQHNCIGPIITFHCCVWGYCDVSRCDKEREVNKEFAIVNVGSGFWLEMVKREERTKTKENGTI